MKLFTYKEETFRPEPYPCWIVYLKRTKYFLGIFPVKSTKTKIR